MAARILHCCYASVSALSSVLGITEAETISDAALLGLKDIYVCIKRADTASDGIDLREFTVSGASASTADARPSPGTSIRAAVQEAIGIIVRRRVFGAPKNVLGLGYKVATSNNDTLTAFDPGIACTGITSVPDVLCSGPWPAVLALLGRDRFRKLLTVPELSLFMALPAGCMLQLTGISIAEEVRLQQAQIQGLGQGNGGSATSGAIGPGGRHGHTASTAAAVGAPSRSITAGAPASSSPCPSSVPACPPGRLVLPRTSMLFVGSYHGRDAGFPKGHPLHGKTLEAMMQQGQDEDMVDEAGSHTGMTSHARQFLHDVFSHARHYGQLCDLSRPSWARQQDKEDRKKEGEASGAGGAGLARGASLRSAAGTSIGPQPGAGVDSAGRAHCGDVSLPSHLESAVPVVEELMHRAAKIRIGAILRKTCPDPFLEPSRASSSIGSSGDGVAGAGASSTATRPGTKRSRALSAETEAIGEASSRPEGASSSTPDHGPEPGPGPSSYAAAPDRPQPQPQPGVMEACTPHDDVIRFVTCVLEELLPQALWDGGHNKNALLRFVAQFVRGGRHDVFTVQDALSGIRTTDFACFGGSGVVGATASAASSVPAPVVSVQGGVQRWSAGPAPAMLANTRQSDAVSCWVLWLMIEVVLPLLRSHFYITDGQATHLKLLYYRKSAWARLCRGALEGIRTRLGLQALTVEQALDVLEAKGRARMGYSILRLNPKPNGLRPITNLRSSRLALPMWRTQEEKDRAGVGKDKDGERREGKRRRTEAGSAATSASSSSAAAGPAAAGPARPVYPPRAVGVRTRMTMLANSGPPRSINFLLSPVHEALKYEHRAYPAVSGANVSGMDGVHAALRRFAGARMQARAAAGPSGGVGATEQGGAGGATAAGASSTAAGAGAAVDTSDHSGYSSGLGPTPAGSQSDHSGMATGGRRTPWAPDHLALPAGPHGSNVSRAAGPSPQFGHAVPGGHGQPGPSTGHLLQGFKADVAAAYDSIPQDQVLQIASDLLKHEHYTYRTYSVVSFAQGTRVRDGPGAGPEGKEAQGAGAASSSVPSASAPGDSESPSAKHVRVRVQKLTHPSSTWIPFQDYSAGEARRGLRNVIFIDQPDRTFTKSKIELVQLLTTHIKGHMVYMPGHGGMYRQTSGVPQGSILSTLLCNIFLGTMERRDVVPRAIDLYNRENSKAAGTAVLGASSTGGTGNATGVGAGAGDPSGLPSAIRPVGRGFEAIHSQSQGQGQGQQSYVQSQYAQPLVFSGSQSQGFDLPMEQGSAGHDQAAAGQADVSGDSGNTSGGTSSSSASALTTLARTLGQGQTGPILLMRHTDDWLGLSEGRAAAAALAVVIHLPEPGFGINVRPDKTEASFPLPIPQPVVGGGAAAAGASSSSAPGGGPSTNLVTLGSIVRTVEPTIDEETGDPIILWCGLKVNASTGEVQSDNSRYFGPGGLRDAVKVSFWPSPKQATARMLRSFIRPKCHPVLLDGHLNRVSIVATNVYEIAVIACAKLVCVLRELRAKPKGASVGSRDGADAQANMRGLQPSALLECLTDGAGFLVALVRSRCPGRVAKESVLPTQLHARGKGLEHIKPAGAANGATQSSVSSGSTGPGLGQQCPMLLLGPAVSVPFTQDGAELLRTAGKRQASSDRAVPDAAEIERRLKRAARILAQEEHAGADDDDADMDEDEDDGDGDRQDDNAGGQQANEEEDDDDGIDAVFNDGPEEGAAGRTHHGTATSRGRPVAWCPLTNHEVRWLAMTAFARVFARLYGTFPSMPGLITAARDAHVGKADANGAGATAADGAGAGSSAAQAQAQPHDRVRAVVREAARPKDVRFDLLAQLQLR